MDFTNINFSQLSSIYLIDNNLTNAISFYWLALEKCNDLEEQYNIRNNLAKALSRAGRYFEAIALFKINITKFPFHWQSNASFADILHLLVENSLISQTLSLSLKRHV